MPIEQLLAQYGMKLPGQKSVPHIEREDSEELNSSPAASSPREIESDSEPGQQETAAQSEVSKGNEGGEGAPLPPVTTSSVPTPPATSGQPPTNDVEGVCVRSCPLFLHLFS